MDKLSNAEIVLYASWPEGDVVGKLARRLADTIRENEALKHDLERQKAIGAAMAEELQTPSCL